MTQRLQQRGRYSLPWVYRPAHIIIHLCIFIGVSLWYFDPASGDLDGMTTWVYRGWLILGFGSAPLMLGSYYLVRAGGGHARYIAAWTHLIANLAGFFVITAHAYSCFAAHLISWHNQIFCAVILALGADVLLAILVVDGIRRIATLERLATVLQNEHADSHGG